MGENKGWSGPRNDPHSPIPIAHPGPSCIGPDSYASSKAVFKEKKNYKIMSKKYVVKVDIYLE